MLPIDEKHEDDQQEKTLNEKRREQIIIESSLHSHPIYLYTIPQEGWKPCVRESATFVRDDANKAYLFGGIGSQIFNSIDVLDLGY